MEWRSGEWQQGQSPQRGAKPAKPPQVAQATERSEERKTEIVTIKNENGNTPERAPYHTEGQPKGLSG
jgi:hypothetical protein